MRNRIGDITSIEVTSRVAVVRANLCSVVERRIQMHGAHTIQLTPFCCKQMYTNPLKIRLNNTGIIDY